LKDTPQSQTKCPGAEEPFSATGVYEFDGMSHSMRLTSATVMKTASQFEMQGKQ
jgi:hypothetical protein